VTDAFGTRRPLRPELLFDALHRETVDYVVIGGFVMSAQARVVSIEIVDLTIARTIENCTAFTEVLLSLDA
jgi:hypothetical protein